MQRHWLLYIMLSLCSLSASAAFDSATLNKADKPLEILRITPSGNDVPAGQQISLQFNQPMVSIGTMKRDTKDLPITIKPAVACQWRWLNTSSLACQLDKKNALIPATHYYVTVKKSIASETGKSLNKDYQHSFITKRPKVAYSSFKHWVSPDTPYIQVIFNYPVTRESVERFLSFKTKNGRSYKVSTKIPKFLEKKFKKQTRYTTRPFWIIHPTRPLPENTELHLSVRQGLQGVNIGNERGIERRVITKFYTYPRFDFLGMRCTDLKDKEIFIPAKGMKKKKSLPRCNPLSRIYFRFTSPVDKNQIKNAVTFTPSLTTQREGKAYDPWQYSYNHISLTQPHYKNTYYDVMIPEYLNAYSAYQFSAEPRTIRDVFGRKLTRPIHTRLLTDHRAPSYRFDHIYSVLETGVDSELPLYTTNLNSLHFSYATYTAQGWSTPQQKTIPLRLPEDVSIKIPLKARELLAQDSGIIQGTFSTSPTPRYTRKPEWFFSQVTPFHVEAKVGHNNSLVWVTDLTTGDIVKDANIKLLSMAYTPTPLRPDAIVTGKTDENGIFNFAGLRDLDPKLKQLDSYDNKKPRLMLEVTKNGAIALLPLDYRYRVSMYDLNSSPDFYAYNRKQYGHMKTWGTTAQGVYRAGDTIQYKLFVRDQDNQKFIPAPQKNYHLKVIDPMGKVAHEVKELSLSEFGSASGEFTTRKNAPVGWYRFSLKPSFTDNTLHPMQVLVSDFTPSPFKVRTTIQGDHFTTGDQVKVETKAHLHAGGAYTEALTHISARLKQADFSSTHPVAKGFQFDVQVKNVHDMTVHQAEGKSDQTGLFTSTFTLPKETAILYGKLLVESSVRDDRGKDVANLSSAQFIGRDRFVGVKETSWLLSQDKPAIVEALVVDTLGTPRTNTAMTLQVEYLETKAARVKSAGNAYITQYQHNWVKVSECKLVSLETAVSCQFTPSKAGEYRIHADIKDTLGRKHRSTLYQYATGSTAVVWGSGAGHGLSIQAEQNSYKVGETARYIVKNPYPNAKALITVERYGILKSWVKTFKNSVEVIEIPVEQDYVSGFYVSVMVASPRVDKPIDAKQVDLGKPAFKMGYVKTDVSDPYKQLDISITPDKSVYKPRDTAKIDIQVKPHALDKTPDTELAVVVLDEAVFDLLRSGRSYFDPYKGFYQLDSLDVTNFNLLMRLVGRQKFAKKGANAGGDGGSSLSMRAVFKYVSYWNPSLKTDATGKASINVTLPDNLTGWRVLVMGVTKNDLMGLGDTQFKVNQAIELRPVLPNQVMAGDRFDAGFTVMNRSKTAQEITVQLSATGDALHQAVNAKKVVQVAPFKRVPVWLPVATEKAGEIQIHATAIAAGEQDAVQYSIPVKAPRALETASTYGTTTQESVSESIQIPEAIYADTGEVSVTLSPSVITGVESAFRYMRDYPYQCWEQKLTKGVMASHYQQLNPYIDDTFVWQESQTLPAKTAEFSADFQAENGGMSFFVPKNAYVNPYLSAYTGLAMTWLRKQGQSFPAKVENRLQRYLDKLLRQKNVLPNFYSKGMAASVRAVALAALGARNKVTPKLLKRYFPHVQHMDMFARALYLQAALSVPRTEAIQKEVVNTLLAQADFTSGKVSFNENLADEYRYLLSSPLRSQCTVLSALVAYDEKYPDNQQISDIPFKLVRHITQARKRQGYWRNTQENMFCMNALIDFARVYEKDAPTMQIKAWLGDTLLGEAKFADVKETPIRFAQPITASDVGRKTQMKMDRTGQGRMYYQVQLRYASKQRNTDTVNAGIEVQREYHVKRDNAWQRLTPPLQLRTGELVRVDLFVSTPAARYYVVVDDPVAGGLEPVNRDLATAAQLSTQAEGALYDKGSHWFTQKSWREFSGGFNGFYHKALKHDSARFYADYLRAGNYHLSYVAQAISAGEFAILPTHSEEMYEPDIYGQSTAANAVIVR